MTLQGRAAELNEQQIGHAVFGRQQDYDSSIDGIVRTQASRLRKRLETHYQKEGSAETVRIIIPRGSYVPQFIEEEVITPVADSPAEPVVVKLPHSIAEQTTVPQHAFSMTALLGGLSALLMVLLLLLLAQERSEHALLATNSKPPMHPLWQELFVPGQTTLYIPGDSGLVLFHAFQGRCERRSKNGPRSAA